MTGYTDDKDGLNAARADLEGMQNALESRALDEEDEREALKAKVAE